MQTTEEDVGWTCRSVKFILEGDYHFRPLVCHWHDLAGAAVVPAWFWDVAPRRISGRGSDSQRSRLAAGRKCDLATSAKSDILSYWTPNYPENLLFILKLVLSARAPARFPAEVCSLFLVCRHTTPTHRWPTALARPRPSSAGSRPTRARWGWAQRPSGPSVTAPRATRSPPSSNGLKRQVGTSGKEKSLASGMDARYCFLPHCCV